MMIVVSLLFCAYCLFVFFKKKLQYWFFSYLIYIFFKRERKVKLTDVIFCIVDHFEPSCHKQDANVQKRRLAKWLKCYPLLVSKHKDNDGFTPRYTWFFPPHDDCNNNLEDLVQLVKQGLGEIELHLHHDHLAPLPETEYTLEKKIREAINRYSCLGVFAKDKNNQDKKFAFIHGDWALDNSRNGKYCGVNNELIVLKRCGCYADFTFPSLLEAQPRKINAIYYAKDDPLKPKSYNSGINVKNGGKESGDLMIIQGPIGLRLKNKFPFIAIEAANISSADIPTPNRIDFWVNSRICVKGRPEWIFIKVHTHGAVEPNMEVLLGEAMDRMYSYLEEKYNDGKNFRLHYVTARELYNIVKAAEAGESGNPGQFRDYKIAFSG